jgi:hypothetical protein
MMDRDNTDSEKEYELEYSQITENIYLGSDLCSPRVCKLHEPEFRKLGVTVEISLTAELKDTPTNNVAIYCWIPVEDKHAPSPDQFDFGTSVINEALLQKRKVYIHCRLGFQRMTSDEALKAIMEKRPEINPVKEQIEALNRYQRKKDAT